MSALLTLLCLVPVTLGSQIIPSAGTSENRDEKFLSVFEIVKFNNEMCSASDGNMGVCYTEKECNSKGGVATGSCAKSYGVCCVFKSNTCGETVNEAVTYIESPNYPSMAPTGMCKYNIKKCDSTICQYKVDFEMAEMSGPSMGDCNNDTLTITNVDQNTAAILPSPLCGTLTMQSIYLSVNNTSEDTMLTFNIVSSLAKWRIKVSQISCSKRDQLAPPGCLQYHTETSGTIMSFNNQNGMGELINNQRYSHCVMHRDGYCDMALTATDFMLGAGDDSISFGCTAVTGSTFGTSNSLVYNYTGPYVIPFCSGTDNTAMDSGYCISYLLLPC